MLFVENEPNKDPRINLAIEEYLIKSVAPKEEILMFYINKPSIIVGRNQNTIQEINVDYVQKHDIIVVRRLSGGGAVYHDLGTLNFSFIAPNSPGNFHNFRKFTQPVIKVLMKMGVDDHIRSPVFEIRSQFFRSIVAAGIYQESIYKVGGDPVYRHTIYHPAHPDLGNVFKLTDFDHSALARKLSDEYHCPTLFCAICHFQLIRYDVEIQRAPFSYMRRIHHICQLKF